MKKFFLILFMILLAGIVTAFGISAFRYYEAIHADDPINPYVLVDAGSARIIRGDVTLVLSMGEQYHLLEKDTIITEQSSASVVFWPDRSTTELGENTIFAINKMLVADDYSKIELEASLQEGKAYTNMIRTLYPGSKMTVNIPKHRIVAGVRGTIFSLNLDDNYIHSIDHSVFLKNAGNQENVLLPGEIVRASNIFEKLGRGVLDQIWEDAVALKTTTYHTLHSEKISSAWEKLKGDITGKNYWDEMVRWILGKFEAFKELEIAKKISTLDAEKIGEIPVQTLQKWYQHLKRGDFALERDVIRGVMFYISQADASVQGWLETLANESLWDRMKFPSLDLSHSEKILENFSRNTSIDVQTLMQHLSEKNYADEFTNSLKSFFQ